MNSRMRLQHHALSLRSPLCPGCRFAIPWLGVWLLWLLLAGCAPLAAQSMPLSAGTFAADQASQPARGTAEPAQALSDSQPDDDRDPKPSPTPTIVSPTQLVTSTAIPAPLPTWPARPTGPVSALMYLSQDCLLLWDPRAGGVLPIADGVTTFTASANGQVVAYLQTQPLSANGVQRIDLELYDLQTGQAVTLLKESPPLQQLALSPQGDWVAYRLDIEGGPIYALPVGKDGQAGAPLRLGDCTPQLTGDCSRLDWSPEAEGLVWSDSQGIWLAAPDMAAPGMAAPSMAAPSMAASGKAALDQGAQNAAGPARLVHPAEVSVVDPKGKTAKVAVHFSQPDWYREGRFVLLHVQPLGSSVTWYALLDTLKGKLAEVPDSYGTTPDESFARWLPDGSLLVTHASDPVRRIPPYVRIIQVTPTSPELLIVRKAFDLYSDAIPFSDSTRKIIPTHSVDWPGYPQSGRMPLGISLTGTDTLPVLFQLELQFGQLEKLTDLPADVVQIYWSPDGRHGLLINSNGKNVRLVSFPAQGQVAFYDLLPVFGPEPHSFLWLAATQRP